MRSLRCLFIPRINFRMPVPFFMKLGMYNMAPVPTSTVYFINPSHQSACLYVYLPIGVRQRYCCNNRRIVLRVIFYEVRVVSEESRLVVLPRNVCSWLRIWSGSHGWWWTWKFGYILHVLITSRCLTVSRSARCTQKLYRKLKVSFLSTTSVRNTFLQKLYSEPSLIRSNCGEVIRIGEAIGVLKRQTNLEQK
jgi:hypothetical protein